MVVASQLGNNWKWKAEEVFRFSGFRFSGFRFSVFGFRFSVFGFRVFGFSDFGFSVFGFSGFRFSVFGFSVFGFRVFGFRVFGFSVFGFRFSVFGFRVFGFRFSVFGRDWIESGWSYVTELGHYLQPTATQWAQALSAQTLHIRMSLLRMKILEWNELLSGTRESFQTTIDNVET